MLDNLRQDRPCRKRTTKLLLALCLSLTLACQRKTPDEILDEANRLYQQKDILSASMKYEELIKRFPQSKEAGQARMGRAMCSLMDKDFEKGREQLADAIKGFGGPQTPEGFRGELMRLNTFIMEKRPKEASPCAAGGP
jgi:hypothetical protein